MEFEVAVGTEQLRVVGAEIPSCRTREKSQRLWRDKVTGPPGVCRQPASLPVLQPVDWLHLTGS